LVSTYDKDLSFAPESLFGLQFSADLFDDLSVTAQLVGRGANDFKAKFEWAYLSYELNASWTLQAGRKRLPLFYYSDFFDVGYAYVWIRPPADNYTWQIFNYNGVNALYTGEIGDWSVSGNIYVGEEDDSENKLLTDFFTFEPVNEIWKDIVGGVFHISKDWLEVRATTMTFINEQFVSGVQQTFANGKTEMRGSFYGIAVNMDFENVFVLTEINRFDQGAQYTADTWMISTGYRFDTLTPYASYSQLEAEETDGESHNTTSIGIRWDFHPSAAFKVQYDDVEDKSFIFAVAGDSKSLTFAIDMVF